MAQTSRPFPGTTVGDAGEYTVENWWDVWGATNKASVDFGASGNRDIGVIHDAGNELEPTIDTGADTVDIDTGVALVDGLYYENDAAVTLSFTAPGAGSRTDLIVLRKNYQLATDFNPGSTVPSVLRRTCRITVLEGGSVTQDTTRTTYWDIPIAQVDVSSTGDISNLVDLREFVSEKISDKTTSTTDDEVDVHEVNLRSTGTPATNFGPTTVYQAHSDDNTLREMGSVGFTWKDATDATRESQFVLFTNYQGNEELSAVIVSPSNATSEGNARGNGAVDFQGNRTAGTQVASGLDSVISGGSNNTASGDRSVVSGGSNNTASNDRSVVCGGTFNTASGDRSVVSGGSFSTASGDHSAVIGGDTNTASGVCSAVIGGDTNTADGAWSCAGGRQANTNSFDGVFIWADSENAALTADRADQTKFRCSGGFYILQNDSSAAVSALTIDQKDTDQPAIEFLSLTIATGKTGEDEYVRVKDPSGNTRYLKLYS